MSRGKFITFEGTDAAGKSTQTVLLENYLQQRGISVLQTREPGGTEIGERIRQLVLKESGLDGISETLLMFAARREHLVRKITPALNAGKWVICDRFTDSTFAYQGGGRGVARAFIEQLAQHIQEGSAPDLTFYLQSPPKSSSRPLFDQEAFEREGPDFYRRVADAYKQLAAKHPKRIVLIKSIGIGKKRRSRTDIGNEIHQTVTDRLLSETTNENKII